MAFEKNKKIVLVLSITILIAAALIATVPNNSPGPKIEVAPGSFDFGTIAPNAVEHEFSLKNTGNAPLKILRISTSCGCTTAWADLESILPGRETVLHVKFDPNAMPEPVAGQVLRVVYIKTNDLLNPELEIEITADVLGAAA